MINIEIKGFLPTSLIDYPKKICSVIFLPYCDFRCPYCQNPDLVLNSNNIPTVEVEKVLNYLESRKKWVDGVCITGGEPCLHQELPNLISEIKNIGLLVKLDTNGSNPRMIKYLIRNKLVDYIAMDIKAPLEKYEKVTKVKVNKKKIKDSINLIINSNVDHEMRSTVLPKLHTKDDIVEMAKMIKNAKRYFLQQFRPVKTLDSEFKSCKPFNQKQLESIKNECNKYIFTEIRV